MDSIITIKSFDKILDQIIPNTLVICDLDNTLFDYKSRCAIQTDIKIQECGIDLECVNSLVPLITDLDGFFMLCDCIQWSGSTLIFLTARPESQSIPTKKILMYYKLDKFKILYSGSNPKGKFLISKLPQINKFDKIIFIDDLEKNLNSVKSSLAKLELSIPILTYKFVIK
jgi:hypothetical protein